MLFFQEIDGRPVAEVVQMEGEFYTADIKVDAILSYPWLRDNQLGVFPDLGALAMRDPFVLLRGMQK